VQFRATNDIPVISVCYSFFFNSLNLVGNIYLVLNTRVMLCDHNVVIKISDEISVYFIDAGLRLQRFST